MYAIVEISGKQFRVSKDMKVRVPKLDAEPGAKVGFDRVLLVEDDKGNTTIGSPLVVNTEVAATVVEHGREKKVIVFKKKRRKGYQKSQGHRQGFSVIEINAIGAASKKAAAPKSEAKPVAKPVEKKAEAPKAETAEKKKPAAKAAAKPKAAKVKTETAPAKKAAPKKAAPKKATAAKAAAPKKSASAAKAKPAAKPAAKKDIKED